MVGLWMVNWLYGMKIGYTRFCICFWVYGMYSLIGCEWYCDEFLCFGVILVFCMM